MHQNAIAEGAVEPKGNGAAAIVANRMRDEIRFGGGSVAVVIFRQLPNRNAISGMGKPTNCRWEVLG